MKLTKNYFISEEELVESLKNSGNHHLYLIRVKKQTFILKKYSTKEPERISREVDFYNFLEKNNFTKIPKLIDFDVNKSYLITNYLDTKNNIIDSINNEHIDNYASFINTINSFSNIKSYKNDAKDSFALPQDFIALLLNILEIYKKSPLKEAEQFSANLEEIEKIILNFKINKNILKNLPSRILSPSDVGFHNTLISDDSMYFFDFEYSGLDSPLKLVSDFILQPRYEISALQSKIFLQSLNFVDREFINQLNIIFPLFVIKWILIFYNFLDPKNNIKYENYKTSNFTQRINNAERYFKILKERNEIY